MPEEPDAGTIEPFVDGSFTCLYLEARACVGSVHYSCEPDGEFLRTVRTDCSEVTIEGRTAVCDRDLGCTLCRPGEIFCADGDVVTCNDEGTGYDVTEECNAEAGVVCRQGRCTNLCEAAVMDRSYVGCEFYPVDLDNAALSALPSDNASMQQYSVIVSNPSAYPTEVFIERNNAPQGASPDIELVDSITVLPGDLEVFNLPRREVDGSSSFTPCAANAECPSTEACWCAGGIGIDDPGEHRDCRCRNAADANGVNDGTHSALTSQAYRVRSVLPVIAYQFNPLDNFGVFSNDASLLLPVSAYGETYTVIGWPQTIARSYLDLTCVEASDCTMLGSACDTTVGLCTNPNEHFPGGEDLRASLTIVGATAGTHVTITLGPLVRNVVGVGSYPAGRPGDVWEFDIGPFDVINLETAGFNADFTGTLIDATNPVGVFSGSEASDAPRFDSLANRQCCADHLEEQIFPRETLGREFYIGRMPPRTVALNAAFTDPTVDSVGEFNEPEYVRVVAVESGTTTITTTMPPPFDSLMLEQNEEFIFEATQNFQMTTSQAVAVMQVIASQQAVGIPNYYPGGDPASIAVPPKEQYRDEYVFLTPNLYAFDFVVITAPRTAEILLDERPLTDFQCTVSPADGVRRRDGDPPPDWVVYQCQLTFPDVPGRSMVLEGDQGEDGYHTLRATADVGLVVYGFDAYVSYAYAAGLNLETIN